jgi:hypothetical protein
MGTITERFAADGVENRLARLASGRSGNRHVPILFWTNRAPTRYTDLHRPNPEPGRRPRRCRASTRPPLVVDNALKGLENRGDLVI